MKIINIRIDDFGCLSGKSFDLSHTFNLVMGNNESGKSTLLAFIKFIFYGLPRKTQENTAERERSLSWNGNTAAGSLTFSTDAGDKYTVERRVTRRMGEKRESISESLRIIDEKTGLEVHKGEIPGELFLGVPAPVFESTCFIRQSGVTNINTDDLGSALENILLSADESIDLQRSLDRLDGARKLLLHKNGKGGSLYETDREVSDLSTRLGVAKADFSRILTKTDELDERRRETLEKRRELDRLDDVFSAISRAALVKRFDTLHQNENELKEIEKEADEFCKANAAHDGFLPSTEYTAALTESLTAYLSAKDEHDRARRILDEIGTEKEREENAATTECPLSADEIRSMGGADKICGDIESLVESSEKKKKSGKALTLLFAVFLAIGAVLSALSFIIPIRPMFFGGIGAVAVSVIFAVLSAASASSSKKAIKSAEARLSELGSTDATGLSINERITLLHSLLLSALEREGLIRAIESKFALASSAVDLRRADLEAVTERSVSLMKKWRLPEGDVQIALTGAISGSKSFTEKYGAIKARITEAKGRIDSLKKELEGYNEADLRARVPAEALEAYEKGDESDIVRRKKFCSDALRSMNEKVHETEMELIRLENETENPARVAHLLEEARKKYSVEKLKYDAIMLASEALAEAGDNIRNSVSPIIRKSAEEYMASITDGKYGSMGIGGDYSMTADTRPVDLLSAGTRDSAYISLRLALLEVIYRSEKPFLAVDEALSQLDDGRAAAALRLLASYCDSGGQCILFTCHTREEKLIDGIANANIIRL